MPTAISTPLASSVLPLRLYFDQSGMSHASCIRPKPNSSKDTGKARSLSAGKLDNAKNAQTSTPRTVAFNAAALRNPRVTLPVSVSSGISSPERNGPACGIEKEAQPGSDDNSFGVFFLPFPLVKSPERDEPDKLQQSEGLQKNSP